VDIQATVEKIAGVSFDEFFKRFVAGADPFPYQATLKLAGLELRETQHKRAALGFFAENANGALTIRSVDANGTAAAAGLQDGDVIVKWNGGDPPRRSEQWLRQQKPGDDLHLRVHRADGESDVNFHLGETTETFYDVAEDGHATEKARHIRDGLLHGVTSAAVHTAR